MTDGEDHEPPLNEPVIIPCVYASGFEVQPEDGIIRLVAFVRLPDFGGETTERRIVARAVMTTETAIALNASLQSHIRASRRT